MIDEEGRAPGPVLPAVAAHGMEKRKDVASLVRDDELLNLERNRGQSRSTGRCVAV